jgi:hypothetical protein
MHSQVDGTLLEPLLKHVVEAYALLPDKAALEKELSIYLIESARRELGLENPDMHLVVGALRLARNELSHAPRLQAVCRNIDVHLESLPVMRNTPSRTQASPQP